MRITEVSALLLERATPRTLWLLLPALLSAPLPIAGQRVVPVHQEPRHRVLYDSERLQVLDIQIQPGDTTLFHTHATPITYVTIGTSTTDARSIDGEWSNTTPRTPPPGRVGAVRAVASYAEQPVTHQVTNVGSSLFRLIGIPNLGGGDDRTPAGPIPGEVLAEQRWFRHAEVELAPGTRTDSFTATAPVVLVLIEPGRVAVEDSGGWSSSMEEVGSVKVLLTGAIYRLRNGGDRPARIVVVEVR